MFRVRSPRRGFNEWVAGGHFVSCGSHGGGGKRTTVSAGQFGLLRLGRRRRKSSAQIGRVGYGQQLSDGPLYALLGHAGDSQLLTKPDQIFFGQFGVRINFVRHWSKGSCGSSFISSHQSPMRDQPEVTPKTGVCSESERGHLARTWWEPEAREVRYTPKRRIDHDRP